MADIEKFVYYSNGLKKVLQPNDRILVGIGGLAFEGDINNDFKLELAVIDPTADRTITFPNATGNVLIDSQDLVLNDNIKIKLGTGNDLEIFHDGTNSIIKDTANSGGSTIKYLAGTQTFQNKDANKTMAVFNAAGSVDLHHNGNKKFETTATGVQTTGNININGAYTFPTSDGTSNQVLQTDGNGTLSFASISSNLSNVTSTSSELNILDTSAQNPSTNDFLMYNGTSLVWDKPEEVIVAELSIPGLDLQVDTNAFRFNCPFGLVITKLELYLDQHTTSGDVTVTLTNTTDTNAMISLTLGTTTTSGSTTTISNSSCDAGDILTLAITATPANAQGLRANLFFERS